MNNRGQHNTRVAIYAATRTPDGAGGETRGLSLVAAEWYARIVPSSGDQAVVADREEISITHQVFLDQGIPGGIARDYVIERADTGEQLTVASVRLHSEGSYVCYAYVRQRGN